MKPLLLTLATIALLMAWAAPRPEPDEEAFRAFRYRDEFHLVTVIRRDDGRCVATAVRTGERFRCGSCRPPDRLQATLPDGRKLTAPIQLRSPAQALLTESEVQPFLLELEQGELTDVRKAPRYRSHLPAGRLYLDVATRIIQGPSTMDQDVAVARLTMLIESKVWEEACEAAIAELKAKAGAAASRIEIEPVEK